MSQLFAVDVGGTFTDLVVLDAESGDVTFAKASTTPAQPSEGVLDAIGKSDLSLPEAETFFHGTTLGINTMLERKGARTGLITTRGFRDVLEIARMLWPMYQLHWDQPEPLVPRYLRKEVSERIRARRRDPHRARRGRCAPGRGRARRRGHRVDRGLLPPRLCVSPTRGAHGRADRRRVPRHGRHPVASVTREYREYERTSTTVSDAVIKPRMASYIDSLETALAERDFDGGFLITRCDGGVMSSTEAKERCIRTLISGPASGAMGVVALGRWLQVPNLIGTDMGGTSFDACLIVDGEPMLSSMTKVEGLPLLVPVIDLTTIGAGGGSIAWIDTGGALNVGPQSAGAVPGPICYGKGGTEPTFTDAALISGILDPEKFLGGEIALDVDAARSGIEQRVAEPLGLDLEEAASGIVALTEAKMAATLEELTIGKGLDPREV